MYKNLIFYIIIMSTDNASSSFYNENNPASSNCLYSGPYSGVEYFVPSVTYMKFCLFTPEDVAPPRSMLVKNQITVSPFQNSVLPRTETEGPETIKWGSGNALLNSSSKNTKSFGYRDITVNRFMTLSSSIESHNSAAENDKWYLYPYFFSLANNTTPDNTNDPTTKVIPFKRWMSLHTPTYGLTSGSTYLTSGKSTTQTISIENRNTSTIRVNLKMYLCTTTYTSSSCAGNPYGVRITIRDTTTSTTLSTNTDNNNNLVYCIDNTSTQSLNLNGLTIVKGSSAIIPEEIILKSKQVIDITMMKIVASPPSTFDDNTFGVGTSDTSILFIDTDSLIFTTPEFSLTSLNADVIDNVNTYYYGNLNQMSFSCLHNPNNINGDNIVGQSLTLNIYKKSSTENTYTLLESKTTTQIVDSSNVATFNFNDNTLLTSGEYKCVVTYDESQVNKSLLPDTQSHYYDGISNEIVFNIVKQPILVNYNTSQLVENTLELKSKLSILKQHDFKDFIITDVKSLLEDKTISLSGNMVFTIADKSNNTIFSSNKTTFNELIFDLKDIDLKHSTKYKFCLEFTPNDPEILSYTTEFYEFTTETPLLQHYLLDNNMADNSNIVLGYLTNATLECNFEDSSQNIYSQSDILGTGFVNFYKDSNDSNKDINVPLNYDASGNIYRIIFSPKSLNLLRYSPTIFNIKTHFELNNNNEGIINLVSTQDKNITFTGVELIVDISNVNPNIYEQITLSSHVRDRTTYEIYSINDISGVITYTIQNNSNTFKTKVIDNQIDKKFEYSFIANDLNITTIHNPVKFVTTFTFSDNLINELTETNEFNIKIISPTIEITPKSEINDYHYEQEFDIGIFGLEDKNDFGTLILYGKAIAPNNLLEVARIEDASLNQSYVLKNINIDDLVEDDVLSNLQENQIVNGLIRWVPLRSDVYESIEDTFQITLSKTETRFDSIEVLNNGCDFTEAITINGKIMSNYIEKIDGKVELFNSQDENTVISQSELNGQNEFTITVTSSVVTSYIYMLKFIPTYQNVYLDASFNNNNYINFIKFNVDPVLVVENLNTHSPYTDDNDNIDVLYTDNFSIGINNLEPLNNTNLVIKIGDDYTSEPFNIVDGKIQTNRINLFELNKTLETQIDIDDPKSITLDFVGYNDNDDLKALYSISMPNKNIQFIRDESVPTINNIVIVSQETGEQITSLNIEESFNIIGNFNLIKNDSDTVIPITGILKLYVGNNNLDDPKILNDDLTISSVDQTIFEGFTASDYEIYSGDNVFRFEFVANDTNINSASSTQLNYTITAATINSVTLNLRPINNSEVTYFEESFEGTISLFNIGIYGDLEIYCKNPSDDSDEQLLATVKLTEQYVNETKDQDIYIDFSCQPINFVCLNDVTTYNIIVKFVSGNYSKYSDNTISQVFNYNISKIGVKLNTLTINDINFNDFEKNDNNQKKIGDLLTLKGSVHTQNGEPVKNGQIKLVYVTYDENGNYTSNPSTTIELQSATTDNTDNTTYVDVSSNGEFTCSILFRTTSKFYLAPGSSFQILYKNSTNYSTTYFSYEDVWGIYSLYVYNRDLDTANVNLILNKSELTNSYNFSYHEDILHFYLDINEDFSYFEQSSIILKLYDSNNGNPIGNGNTGVTGKYSLDLVQKNKVNNIQQTFGYAEIFLNPKTENIENLLTSNYSAKIEINTTGYNTYNEILKDISDNVISFNVKPTIPEIELVFTDPVNNTIITSINYEESVDIYVKVKPTYEIHQNSTQTKNIIGSLVLRNQKDSNEDGTIMNVEQNNEISDIVIFDSIDSSNGSYSSGKVVRYSPKNNSDNQIIDIKNIFGLFIADYDNVSTKYTSGKISAPFLIEKYTPILEISSITPENDIQHADPSNNIDDKYIYYHDTSSVIQYNGFVNYDEKFKVTCSLIKNLAGTIEYYYANDTNNYIEILPETDVISGNNGITDDSNNIITALFSEKLLQIPNDQVYSLKAIFKPNEDNSYFYNHDDSPAIYFNIYQSNNFGTGNIFWDTNNNSNLSNIKSFTNDQSITIAVSFEFDNIVNKEDKRCEVTFFHTSFENAGNKFYGPIYLDLSNSDARYITSTFTIPATTFIYNAEPYSIRALFKPVLSDNTKNSNYPIMVERNPLTLIIKPFITTDKTNFTYQYNDPISLIITLNSGNSITDITPYSKLIFNIVNFDSSTVSYTRYYEHDLSGVVVNFDNFQNVINTDTNLRPGKYTLKIYATNTSKSNYYKTEEFSTIFTIVKKSVSLSLTFDKYSLSYRSLNLVKINIDNFPLEVGKTDIIFTNVETLEDISKNILSSELQKINDYDYEYTINDISTWLESGLYKVNVTLDNEYYTGSQSDSSNNRLLVTKETQASIVFNNSLNDSMFTSIFGDNLNLSSSVRFSSEIIQTGQLYLNVNNGDERTIGRDFIIYAESLVKDINNCVLYFKDNNYETPSLPFQVNVKKQIKTAPEITYNESNNTEDIFTLNVPKYEETNNIYFYNLSSISELTPTSTSDNNYTFNFTSLLYGENNIYAIIRSPKYDVKTSEVTVVRNKYNTSIVLNSTTFLDTYSANSLIDIKYKVVKQSSENTQITGGMVEFHKLNYAEDGVTIDYDEIIDYVSVVDNSAQLLEYKLVPNARIKPTGTGEYYDNKIRFYAKFINNVEYHDSESEKSSMISIYTKAASRIIDDTVLADNYRIGDSISLEYIVAKSTTIDANTTDENIRDKINAEQLAISNEAEAIQNMANKESLLNDAKDELTNATSEYNSLLVELQTITSTKNDAFTALNQAKLNLDNAKLDLDAVVSDKDDAELAFRTIQEVTKLAEMNLSLNDASNALPTSEENYINSKNSYDNENQKYLGILSDISMNNTEVTNKMSDLNSALIEKDLVSMQLSEAEQNLNIAQINYQIALTEYNDLFELIKEQQSQLIELQKYLTSIEDAYDTKKADYETKQTAYLDASSDWWSEESVLTLIQTLTDASSAYDEALQAYDASFTTYTNNVNDASASLLNANTNYTNLLELPEKEGFFTLGDLSNVWIIIDQQSTNDNAEIPFISIFTHEDTVSQNHNNLYKSRLNYKIDENSTITTGLMILYAGVDPGVHTNITNRVKLNFDVDSSNGLQESSEFVKRIAIQTEANGDKDYNFVFKAFGSIGTTANANISFIPTPDNNTSNVYYDASGQVQGIDVSGGGWLFNNNQASEYINWRIFNPTSEEFTVDYAQNLINAEETKDASQQTYDAKLLLLTTIIDDKDTTLEDLTTATTNFNTAKEPLDNLESLRNQAYDIYEPIMNDYNSTVVSIEKYTLDISYTDMSINSVNLKVNDTLDDVSSNTTSVETYRETLQTKTDILTQANTDYDAAFDELDKSKAKLTTVTNGKTIEQLVNSLLADMNNKYIIWQAYVKYLDLKQNHSNSELKEVLVVLSKDVSDDFDEKFNIWNSKLELFRNTDSSYNIAFIDYTNADNAVTDASNVVYNVSNNILDASSNYEQAKTDYNTALNAKQKAFNDLQTVLDGITLDRGYVIFYKYVTNGDTVITQILGQVKPDYRGLAILPYTFTETGVVNFYAKITELPDYYDSQTLDISTNVLNRIDTSVRNNTNFNKELYKTGDKVTLSYTAFKLIPDNTIITDGYMAIYKKIGSYEQILDYQEINTTNNGTIIYEYVLTDSGDVSFYAKYIYSIKNIDCIGEEQQIKVVKKLNSSIEDMSIFDSVYKIGSIITLKYKITSTNNYNVNGSLDSRTEEITEGVVEVHKVVDNLDEVIGYLQLSNENKGVVSMPFELVDVGTVKFYVNYMGTKTYYSVNNNSNMKQLTSVDKYTVTVTNVTEMEQTVSKKLGDVVELKYTVSYNNSPVNEGIFEIIKSLTKNDVQYNEILGYAIINNGNAVFSHQLKDIDCQIQITSKFINSINYKEIPSTSNFANIINVFSKYYSKITRTSVINDENTYYKLGESIYLEYMVTDMSNMRISDDGTISIHKVVINDNVEKDEIIYYQNYDPSNNISYTYKITSVGETSFYATYSESANYYDSNSELSKIISIKEYENVTNKLTVSNNELKYGETLTLTSTLENSSEDISEGSIEFYATIESNKQLIAVVSVNNNTALYNYVVNDIGNIEFTSVFKNSSNYIDVSSNVVTSTVLKNSITDFSFSTITPMAFDLVNVQANITYGTGLTYKEPGVVEFVITNNDISNAVTVDVYDNKSVYQLYVSNTSEYTITAKFMGNDLFDESNVITLAFTPSTYDNYDTLTYTETEIKYDNEITSNYFNILAILTLKDDNVDEKFLLLNKGFIVFEALLSNGQVDDTKTVIVNLVDGKAKFNVRKEINYTYAVKYIDDYNNPKITILGTK